MNLAAQMPATRHVYRLKTWATILYFLLALFIGGMGAFAAYMIFNSARSAGPAALVGLLPLVFGVYMLALVLRSRLIIEGAHIEVRGAFQEKSAELSQIEGFRTISSRNGSYQQLYLKDDRGTITLPTNFNTDDDFRAWFQQVPDLDELDRKTLLDEIASQQELGATPEERLGALSKAKTYSIASLVATIAVAIAINLDYPALLRPGAIVLALVPIAAGFMVWRSPLLYTVLRKKKDPRAEVSFVMLASGLGLLLRLREIHFISLEPLLLSMVLVGAALAFLYFNSARGGVRGALIGLLFFIGLYSYGTVAVADACFDSSKAMPFSTTVVGGHVSSGRSTTYYLRLAPWGPVETAEDASVLASVYRRSTLGETICLELHDGRLHAPWYRLVDCPAALFGNARTR